MQNPAWTASKKRSETGLNSFADETMSYWIFKVSDRGSYPDSPGAQYVYDNTHSVRVQGGDEFIYLKKSATQYGLDGAGRVSRVIQRSAGEHERRSARVRRLFTAHLADVIWFPETI